MRTSHTSDIPPGARPAAARTRIGGGSASPPPPRPDLESRSSEDLRTFRHAVYKFGKTTPYGKLPYRTSPPSTVHRRATTLDAAGSWLPIGIAFNTLLTYFTVMFKVRYFMCAHFRSTSVHLDLRLK